jgi:BlaI family transcriptional regulator, penicillinase repressor
MRRRLPRPTDAEVAILRVLWTNGPSTVRQVHDVLAESRESETGYTTTLKLMQLMTEKGLLMRDASTRTHVYAARVPEQQTQRLLVADLVDRAFEGSAAALVMQALAARPITAEQLKELRQLIKDEEESRK